eukprot:TRINITY_DN858_c3_g1_i2.p1 TRINITY_DN858_c3_g1~~TRINITY_DN858_c3_g1_i2.p1  ORF type:complete len:211 (+),score=5.65 TRINITY_DN858_c3_g1_i2:41-634(+)
MSSLQQTLAIIKPDAVENGHTHSILHSITELGFTILQQEVVTMNIDQAREFYAEHKGQGFYHTLTEYMSRGPCRILVLGKTDGIASWRKELLELRKVYAPDPENPGEAHPTYNALHGSSDLAAARREIKFWFNSFTLDTVPTAQETRDYVDHNLKPILVKALTQLAKVRPHDEIRWLSKYLLEHNPNKPCISVQSKG